MENEKTKLLNVLRRISRAAGYAAWARSEPDAVKFCVGQYNRVLARLSELEPSINTLFTPLSESSSPQVTRIAARELLAYFEADEPDFARGFYFRYPRRHRGGCVSLAASCD